MAIEIDRTQYPISIDGINSDLQDISAKLDILNEFTDGVVDNHLSETEHHLVHRQKRLLVLLRDVLKDHRSLLYDTVTESEAISFRPRKRTTLAIANAIVRRYRESQL